MERNVGKKGLLPWRWAFPSGFLFCVRCDNQLKFKNKTSSCWGWLLLHKSTPKFGLCLTYENSFSCIPMPEWGSGFVTKDKHVTEAVLRGIENWCHFKINLSFLTRWIPMHWQAPFSCSWEVVGGHPTFGVWWLKKEGLREEREEILSRNLLTLFFFDKAKSPGPRFLLNVGNRYSKHFRQVRE